jgi:hypothetical protein
MLGKSGKGLKPTGLTHNSNGFKGIVFSLNSLRDYRIIMSETIPTTFLSETKMLK